MTWSSPATPVGGTAITVAFWNLNARDNLNHLRALLPDPGSSGKVLQSDGASSAAWVTPSSTFSAGMVMYWNASSASIPSGWAELSAARDRVIIGANNLYAYNATGGAATVNLAHSHTVNSHDHSFSGAHTHTIATHTHAIDAGAMTVGTATSSTSKKMENPSDDNVSYPKVDHNHTVSGGTTSGGNNTDSGTASGTTGAATPGTDSQLSATQSVLNPYLALTVMVKT